MKGPDQRIKLDVRRVWECPECHTRRRAPADVVSMRCTCQSGAVWMRLVEDDGGARANRLLDEFQALAEAEESQ